LAITPILSRSAEYGNGTVMRISVDTYIGHNGVEMPRRFRLDGREIDVCDNIDQWFGSEYCYFKVRGADGHLYILRLDEARNEWELTMFQRARSQAVPATPGANKGPIESARI
jgi:hypothetical protein